MIPLRARYRKIPEPADGVVGAVNALLRLERADRDVVERVLMNVWDGTRIAAWRKAINAAGGAQMMRAAGGRCALWWLVAIAVGCGAPSGSPGSRGDTAPPSTSASAPDPGCAGPPPGAQDEAALDDLRHRLQSAAERYEPCASTESAIVDLDHHLYAHPQWGRAYSVLADALRLRDESCPAGAAGSKHASSVEEALRRAVELGGGSDPAARTCDVDQDVAAAEALRRKGEWAGAVTAYRKALFEPCRQGVLHWAGHRHAMEARARLGLSEAALESGDLFDARRQLRRLDLDRAEAVLRTGDEARESALWRRLGDTPPRSYRATDPSAAISELERAAVDDDEAAFRAALSARAPDRALLSGRGGSGRYCAMYAVHRPARLRMCIATRLLPEAPVVAGCRGRGATRVCRVVGADKKDEREVELSLESGSYRVVDRVGGPE